MDGRADTVSLLLVPSLTTGPSRTSGPCPPSLGGTYQLQVWKINVAPKLSITKTGTGTGTVQSSPPGISCGSQCSGSFPVNTPVQLTATPDAGSTFDGW